jgi:hypothetical protein
VRLTGAGRRALPLPPRPTPCGRAGRALPACLRLLCTCTPRTAHPGDVRFAGEAALSAPARPACTRPPSPPRALSGAAPPATRAREQTSGTTSASPPGCCSHSRLSRPTLRCPPARRPPSDRCLHPQTRQEVGDRAGRAARPCLMARPAAAAPAPWVADPLQGKQGHAPSHCRPLLPPPAALGQWDQCGGSSGACGSSCRDASWPGSICPDGFACTRQGPLRTRSLAAPGLASHCLPARRALPLRSAAGPRARRAGPQAAALSLLKA